MKSSSLARAVGRKRSSGKAYGLELYAAGQKPEGQITEVNYMREKPGPNTTPVPKVSFVERAGDIFAELAITSSRQLPRCKIGHLLRYPIS